MHSEFTGDEHKLLTQRLREISLKAREEKRLSWIVFSFIIALMAVAVVYAYVQKAEAAKHVQHLSLRLDLSAAEYRALEAEKNALMVELKECKDSRK